jgi:cytochrome c oxidase subunit 2
MNGGVRAAGWRFLPLLFLLLFGMIGCEQSPQTTITPVTDFGREINSLYLLVTVLAAFVFITVEGALLYAVFRFRARPGDGQPRQIHGNTRLEIAWTLAPALILVVIAVPTIRTIFATQTEPPPNALRVRVIGHQWWWEFQYPDLGIVTANELHLPTGRPVALSLESADVIHSFWVPKLGGKRDAIPNRVNHLWFTIDEPGVYLGQCAEYCGTQHANMRMRVIVQTPAEFEQWVQAQKTVPQPTTAEAQQGAQLFARSACVGCHTVAGTPAQGKQGPDLTHVGSRTTLAAGIIPNTPENLARWLKDPQAIKPGNKMPTLGLSDADIRLLVAYLTSLK